MSTIPIEIRTAKEQPPTAEEVEQFLAKGMEAQKAVDELLASTFAPQGLKPTVGQLARFTAQLAEAERCEQRASELVGEINRLRANAKQLRKAAPKILRELPQLELPLSAPEPIAPDRVEGAASIEPGPGHSLPGGPELEEEDRRPETGPDAPPPPMQTCKREELCEILHGKPDAQEEAPRRRLGPGQTALASELGLEPDRLEKDLTLSTMITPRIRSSGEEHDEQNRAWESSIANPIRLENGYFAIVGSSITSERVTYAVHPVRKGRNKSEGLSWAAKREQTKACAPEDVPLDGVRAVDDDNCWWIFEGGKDLRAYIVAPRDQVNLSFRDEAADLRPGFGVSQLKGFDAAPKLPTPEKPAGQSMTWHQWAQAIRQLKGFDAPVCGAVTPADLWLELYESGMKPTEALDEFLTDMEVAAQDKASGARESTIEWFKREGHEEAIPLMSDPSVNDHGVYVRGVSMYRIQCPKGIHAEIRVAQSAVDHRFRAASDFSYGSGGARSEPGVLDTGYETREYAIRTEAQAMLAQLEVHGKGSSKAEADRIKGLRAAIEKFIKSNAHAQVRTNAQEPPPAAAAKGGAPFRPQTYGQWLATFKGCLRTCLDPYKVSHGYADGVLNDLDEADVKKMHAKGMRPGDAARQYQHNMPHRDQIQPKPKKGAKKR